MVEVKVVVNFEVFDLVYLALNAVVLVLFVAGLHCLKKFCALVLSVVLCVFLKVYCSCIVSKC